MIPVSRKYASFLQMSVLELPSVRRMITPSDCQTIILQQKNLEAYETEHIQRTLLRKKEGTR